MFWVLCEAPTGIRGGQRTQSLCFISLVKAHQAEIIPDGNSDLH